MTPEKFFDYLEGKLPPAEKERLERALIADPELQEQFVSARQVHRGMLRAQSDNRASAGAGTRGRQVAAAFAVLVAMNVALGLIYIFHANKPSAAVRAAQEDALRHQLQRSVEKSAAANFPPPTTIGAEPIAISASAAEQERIAQAIISAAARAGGSATKDLPNEKGIRLLALVPAAAEHSFRETLASLGGPSPGADQPATSPHEIVHFEILLSPK